MVTTTKLLTNDQVWLIAGAAVLAHRGEALLPSHSLEPCHGADASRCASSTAPGKVDTEHGYGSTSQNSE